MRCLCIGAVLAGLIMTVAASGAAGPPEFAPLLHLGFDDNLTADAAGGATVTVSGGEGLAYGEGKAGLNGEGRNFA